MQWNLDLMKYQETREIGLLYQGSVPYTLKARLENVVCYTKDFVNYIKVPMYWEKGTQIALREYHPNCNNPACPAHPPSTNHTHPPLFGNVKKFYLWRETTSCQVW